MRLSSTDHRDRDRLRDQNQHLELVKRHLGRDEQGLKLRNLKRLNLLYGICQFTQDINLRTIDLSRVMDAICAEAQMQERGVQVDAKIGYAGNAVIQYSVINATAVNRLRSTTKLEDAGTSNKLKHAQLEQFLCPTTIILMVTSVSGDYFEMEIWETTVPMAQNITGTTLVPGHSREPPVSRGNAHLRQPVIRGNALLVGGLTRQNKESQAQNSSRDWSRLWAKLHLFLERGCIRQQQRCSIPTLRDHQHTPRTEIGDHLFHMNQFIGRTCLASSCIRESETPEFLTDVTTIRPWIQLLSLSTELICLEYLWSIVMKYLNTCGL